MEFFNTYQRPSFRKGFTLIEMLLSVAVIVAITGISIPIYESFQVRNELDIAAVSIVQSLRRAEALAQSSSGDASWGVHIVSGSVTLFKGSSYATRDATLDEIFTIPTSIVPSGVSDIVFDRLTGFPQSTGTITLTSNRGEARNMTINQKGMVNY